jgi:hypothetical protein
MLNESSEVSIKFARTFKRHLRALSKKYNHIARTYSRLLRQSRAVSFLVTGFRESNMSYSRCE